MPPGPQMRSSTAIAHGAAAAGLHPFPFPMAANSVSGYNGQHACNNCGFCSSFGCPVVARPSALVPLRQALRTGRVELKPETMVTKIEEAQSYQTLLTFVRASRPFGTEFKQLMRASILRDRLAGCSLIGHDLPYLSHTVTLDPQVRDVFGVPVARITWSAGQHEQVAQQFWIPRLKAMMTKAGAGVALAVPATFNSGGLPTGNHIMGGMMMGTDPATSVTDAHGRVHGLDNVYAADGSVFVTSGAHNPTNTIMAVALRSMRQLAGRNMRQLAGRNMRQLAGRNMRHLAGP
jgi:choline dehydrogenase-like flavoprotein